MLSRFLLRSLSRIGYLSRCQPSKCKAIIGTIELFHTCIRIYVGHVAHRTAECKVLGIRWQDNMTNDVIQSKTEIPDLMERVHLQIWKWAGHAAIAGHNKNLISKGSQEVQKPGGLTIPGSCVV